MSDPLNVDRASKDLPDMIRALAPHVRLMDFDDGAP